MDSPGAIAARRWSARKHAGFFALMVVAAIGAAVIADSLFYVRPIVAEKFWIAALRFGVAPLREEAVFRLRNHPTRAAAAALVSAIQRSVRAGAWKDAARATETLCILSGRSFGTSFQQQARGHSWKAPDPGEWPDLLARIDDWAERSLRAAQ